MFISHKYKFVFIKNTKTGGSSVEKFFTDIHKADEYIFGGMPLENMPPHNIKNLRDAEHLGHLIIAKLWPNEWNSYYKFTLERNPWDKVVSLYFYYLKTNPSKVNKGFKEYIESKEFKCWIDDWNRYTKNNIPVVDSILQHSSLNNDMNKICNTLNIPYNNELNYIRLKDGYRANKNYRGFYDQETVKTILDLYRSTIDYFNYKF